jgi:hypothetical protein
MDARHRRYAELIERKRARLERKYIALLRRAFLSQLNGLIAALRTNPFDAVYSTTKFFNPEILDRPFLSMKREAANAFAHRTVDEVVKDFNPVQWRAYVESYLLTIGAERVTEINTTTKDFVMRRLKPILEQGVQDGQGIDVIASNIIRDIDEYKGKFARYRAERIARTEIVSTSNWASLNSLQASGVAGELLKIWIPIADEKTRESHAEMANADPIEMNDDFIVGGERLSYPGDPRGSAENTIQCRCVIAYERKDNL